MRKERRRKEKKKLQKVGRVRCVEETVYIVSMVTREYNQHKTKEKSTNIRKNRKKSRKTQKEKQK